MTIKLNSGTKYSTLKFVGGTDKEAVRFICSFWTLEVKLEYRKDWSFTKKARTAQRKALNGIDHNNANHVTHKEEFDTKVAECSATMKSLHSNLWQLFENPLGSELIPEWQEIVRKKPRQMVTLSKEAYR